MRVKTTGLTLGLVALLTSTVVWNSAVLAPVAAQPGADGAEVRHTVTCLQGGGRIDTMIVNSQSSSGTYRIELAGLNPREQAVAGGDWWRMPVTGRPDGPVHAVVKRDNVEVSDSTLLISCAGESPVVSEPEVTVVNACRDGNGYVLFQFANPTPDPRGYVIRFEGVPNRSTTAAGYGGAVRAVTGRPDGTYAFEIVAGSTTIERSNVVVDCTTTTSCPVDGADGLWTQLGANIEGEALGDQSGWSVAMNAAGNRVIIGAPYNDGATGILAGHARVFELSEDEGLGHWLQVGGDIDGEAVVDESGWSVDMNAAGDRVIIGSRHNNGNGTSSGHARVYALDQGDWTQLGADIDGATEGEQSGYSVAMNAAGDRVIVGARLNGLNSGQARIYELDATTGIDGSTGVWRQVGGDIDGETTGDQAGWSVAMNAAGDRVVIGAPFNDGENGIDSGHARIYQLQSVAGVDGEPHAWVQVGGDIDGESIVDESGRSVDINAAGDRVIIGAPSNEGSDRFSGHARVYRLDDGVGQIRDATWAQVGGDIDGELIVDFSGGSVAIDDAGDTIVVGASLNDGGGNLSGHARIYRFDSDERGWSQVGADIDGDKAFDYLGHAVAINAVGDRAVMGAPGSDSVVTGAGFARVVSVPECASS